MNAGVPIVWIDCEMTGLDLSVDALIEVGVVITDQELQILDPGLEVVILPPESSLTQMSDFVRNMHQESGLLEVLHLGNSLSKAEELILSYLERMQVPAGKSPLGGNSPWMDRSFIARDMPQLNQFLHYRTIDVSSIKELAKRWYPSKYFKAPEKTGNHRALSDAQDSIRELAYYRSEIFAAPNSASPQP
jgi:oligoribonuclease